MFGWYRTVMDAEQNPLRHLPPAQRFQIMVVLSMMWTAIFCAGAGVWFLYGELVALHVLLALGTLFTGWAFRAARPVKSYRDYPKRDGTARYDDVWGA
jgi:hypothetical protein